MKVRELIALLEGQDPEIDVLRPGYDGGLELVSEVRKIRYVKNLYKRCYGISPHAEVRPRRRKNFLKGVLFN